jgi:hypothetical protein
MDRILGDTNELISERIMFEFDPSFINEPSPKYEIMEWGFSQDLRQFFPETDGRGKYGNNTIGDILKERGVANRLCSVDTEYSCTYVRFKTERAARAFLKRLNAMPEVKDYVAPERPPEKGIYMSVEDWQQLKAFVKDNLTPDQYTKLQALDTKLWEIEL